MSVRRLYVRQTLRHLSSTPYLYDVSPSILDILREKSPYTDKRKKILILSPEETKDKTISKFVQSHKNGPSAKTMSSKVSQINGLEFEPVSSPSNIIETMKSFKAARSKGSISSDINSTILTLQKSFTKNQLLEYVEGYGKVPSKSKTNKARLSEYIVRHIWNEAVAPTDMVFATKRVRLSHKEMFLLLSQKGWLLRLLRSTVASLDFDMDKSELVLVGTDYQLQNATINLQHKFENVYAEEFDFTTIQSLYEKKYGAFTFKDIGKLVEVYFSHLDGNKYELCAFNASQVRRIKRLLVWFLDYNLHTQNTVHLPTDLSSLFLVPYNDTYGMAWKSRTNGHFRLSGQTSEVSASRSLKRELENFSQDRLKKLSESGDDTLSQSIPAELAQETYDILDSLGLSRDDLDDQSELAGHIEKSFGEDDMESGHLESVDTESASNSMIPAQTRDKLYKQLTDFTYRQSLHGVSEDDLDSPMFTVTLGHVLFEQANQMPQASSPITEEIAKNHSFNTNVPLVHDRTLSKALAGEEPTNLEVDPHIYSLQFKFLPSPYVSTDADLDSHIKYPPIEMWMQVNDNSTPDIESMQVVTVEGENNVFVCLPEQASDMKITCQLTGRVLAQDTNPASDPASDNEVETIAEQQALVEEDALTEVLSAPADKYPRLRTQAGIRQFLQESRLDFSGKKPTSVASTMTVDIDGKPIEYSFVSMNYRRELLVEIEDNKTAQLSIVDGGSLGGRRVEVRFVGDLSGGIDRANFDDLLDYTCRFVNDL